MSHQRDSSERVPAVDSTAAGAATASGCINPIRLRGYLQRIDAQTGELLAIVGSSEQPDGILVVACKDRRASRCPMCARLYERDAYQLIASGLRGGKTVPASVGSHPAVMLTLTAPSFGQVHGNRDRAQRCPCGHRHDADDPLIGTALHPDRYRHAEQVIWNHYAPQLWKRTVQEIRRALARALGVPRSSLSRVARVRFAKVAEFQRRGVVHYHAIIRIDGPGGVEDAPPGACTTGMLIEVVHAAAAGAIVAISEAAKLIGARTEAIKWGAQREIVALDHQTCTAAAGYIAKYATKATEAAAGGFVLQPIRSSSQLADLDLPDHAQRLVRTAWSVGGIEGLERVRRWAHQFGYGGHTLTKSHRYSTTFVALRAARTDWHHQEDGHDQVVVRAKLTYAGRALPRTRSLALRSDDRSRSTPTIGRS